VGADWLDPATPEDVIEAFARSVALGSEWLEWYALDPVSEISAARVLGCLSRAASRKNRHELNFRSTQLTDNIVFMVFWMERAEDGKMAPRSQEFGAENMSGGLALMEALRKSQLNGAEVRHITMSSENPDSVGRRGVDVVGVGYSWTKRRSNERRRS
jgi:hypothetical protein